MTPGPVRRRARTAADPVTRSFVDDDFCLVLQSGDAAPLAPYVAAHREELLAGLDRHCAVLFRGFSVPDAASFGAVARGISPDLLGYLERAAPREEVADKVFTSTEFASDQVIPLHHEMSYAHNWPSRLYFYCDLPAESGGATPLAGERRFTPRLPAEIRERFLRHGVMYVRNYGEELDLPWQEVFQTSDRAEVEAYCRASNTEFQWTGGNGLRTRAVRQAMARHPRTGEQVWFNHTHLFHVSNMPAEVAETLIGEYGLEGLPRNAYYGDGSPIEPQVVDLIRNLYQETAVSFPWRRGDVLMVDNFLATHGREPFTGERRTLVAMSDLYVNRALPCP
ncbi:TauD/TfdA family dioxygenase [Streptomyces fuscichromogenes]|uniref:TauD/TfdA family dioxygenase n=1 Tax=Streptomyces fuscichromogenes TaxID=1324013 RepID=UPI003801629F